MSEVEPKVNPVNPTSIDGARINLAGWIRMYLAKDAKELPSQITEVLVLVFENLVRAVVADERNKEPERVAKAFREELSQRGQVRIKQEFRGHFAGKGMPEHINLHRLADGSLEMSPSAEEGTVGYMRDDAAIRDYRNLLGQFAAALGADTAEKEPLLELLRASAQARTRYECVVNGDIEWAAKDHRAYERIQAGLRLLNHAEGTVSELKRTGGR